MIKDFNCEGCGKGPCVTDCTAVRLVLTNYCRNNRPTSDLWKKYDFTGTYQCMEVINGRSNIFECERCGHYFEDHMLHIIVDSANYKWKFCPDCYERNF